MIVNFPSVNPGGSLDYSNTDNDVELEIAMSPFAVETVATSEAVIGASGRVFPSLKSKFLKRISIQIPVINELDLTNLYGKYSGNSQNPVRITFEPPEAEPESHDGIPGVLYGLISIQSGQSIGVDPAGGLLYSLAIEFKETIE